jgi:hypothetical protein
MRDAARWLEECRVSGVFVGGVAYGLLVRARTTADVDLLIETDDANWPSLVSRAAAFDLCPRRPSILKDAQLTRLLLLRHKPTGIAVDVCCGASPYEEQAVARAVVRTYAGLSLRVPRPEDLLIMKAVAHRPQDFGDIGGILEMYPHLDLRYVRRWVRDYARTLDSPDIVKDFEWLIRRSARKNSFRTMLRRKRKR